ncbi:MAG: hypothetical protein ACU0CI_03745 [Shimia sp.]
MNMDRFFVQQPATNLTAQSRLEVWHNKCRGFCGHARGPATDLFRKSFLPGIPINQEPKTLVFPQGFIEAVANRAVRDMIEDKTVIFCDLSDAPVATP